MRHGKDLRESLGLEATTCVWKGRARKKLNEETEMETTFDL